MVRMTIGWRLTLWYGAFWALSLGALAGSSYLLFSHNLLAEIDRALEEELAEIETEVVSATDAVERESQLRKYFGEHPFYGIQVARPDGEAIFKSERLSGAALPVPALRPDGPTAADENVDLGGAHRFRAASRLVRGFDGPLVIQAAESLELYDAEMSRLVAVLAALLPTSLIVALAVGHWLSRRALDPVDRLTTAAVRISADQLAERVSVSNPADELGRLAAAFNAMLERLQRSFQEMRQFTADAAHELRTPLAVLRSEADVALHSLRTPAEYQQVLANQLDEIDRMTRMVDQLLFLSREEASAETPAAAPVSMRSFLEELVDDLQPLAHERGLSLECAPLPACQVAIDADRLRRLFCNVLDNALKYTPTGGHVSVSGACRTQSVEIIVADDGSGVAEADMPHLFRRFYRAAAVRGDAPGSGLGLAICDAIVKRHGGRISLESAPGRGTRVTVTLPTTVAGA